jgi:mitochondrial fission protein ELM1|tara:strand:+ start:1848 stop:2786 length:939 start_codon:yes stop_codon:yes gene_type:complete
MDKLKGLLLTEGMHGMISQVEGLAKAMDLDFVHQKVELNAFWKLIPPRFTPVSKFVFKNFQKTKFDFIISCGRKSVVPSIFLKKNSNRKVYNIHIQDPKVSKNNFDFIIAPEHDGLKGENVITSKGAIHYLTDSEIQKNHNYLLQSVSENKDKILMIIGGPNKYYEYSEKNIKNIFTKVQKIIENNDLTLIVIPSMRTPKKVIDLALNYFDNKHLIIKDIDKKAYLSALSIAKYIIVTCDSTSMISESAITGKPIYIADIPSRKNDRRFKEFRKLFTNLNIIKTLGDNLEIWNYEKLDETNRIAKIIRNKLQ